METIKQAHSQTQQTCNPTVPPLPIEREAQGGDDAHSERRLWTAVIIMAVEDWCSGNMRARREAQQFLFEDSNDFQEVCSAAGLDPSSLRAKLLRIGHKVDLSHVRHFRFAA